MSILLITPPLTGLNTTYPSTTVLTGYLRSVGHRDTEQWDMSIALAEAIFSSNFLQKLFDAVELNERFSSAAINVYLARERYVSTIDGVWRFLRGADPTLASRMVDDSFLPRGPRFDRYDDDELALAFGVAGTAERAKHFATLYIQDLTDFICEVVDEDFDLIRYGEQLAMSLPSLTPLLVRLERSTIISDLMTTLLNGRISTCPPSVVGFTIPFPGCLIAALRCARHIKEHYPQTTVVFGGGYVNTELRSIADARIFDFVDFIVYDDGELPLQRIVEHGEWVRTKFRNAKGEIVSQNMTEREPFVAVPDFDGIDTTQYVSLLEMANPMHRLWSDGFWNKITAAHGCYWAKCAFCDTSLDYIGRYDPLPAAAIVDNMERIMTQTGSSGFHFTDEALPPKLIKQIAAEIIDRGLTVSYWGNIRFEKSFTKELCGLLARSGCIAVSGGLEVASPKILHQINKGVTIENARTVMENLTSNFIMVHAYLMYGFPGQSIAQTRDSLEVVRSMFENGLIQSAFWHRFTMTIHSPIGICPTNYGAKITGCVCNDFANNGVDFSDDRTYDIDAVGNALSRATYNYMHGLGFEHPARHWL